MKNLLRERVYSYRQTDRKRGFTNTIDMDFAIQLMGGHCTYCGETPANGLDRIHSDQGHVAGNCVACCEKCNFILGDLPFSAKRRLIPGLREIRSEGCLKSWIPPIKRKN